MSAWNYQEALEEIVENYNAQMDLIENIHFPQYILTLQQKAASQLETEIWNAIKREARLSVKMAKCKGKEVCETKLLKDKIIFDTIFVHSGLKYVNPTTLFNFYQAYHGKLSPKSFGNVIGQYMQSLPEDRQWKQSTKKIGSVITRVWSNPQPFDRGVGETLNEQDKNWNLPFDLTADDNENVVDLSGMRKILRNIGS